MFLKQFELRYFEMNKHGEASPTTILTLLEETASDHCNFIGHGLYDLVAQNIGWVLASGVIEMYRYPKYKEQITIQTWLSHYTLVKGIRENLILDAQGVVIGRAKGLWVFFDIHKRKPVQIFDDILQKWPLNKTQSIEYNILAKLKPLDQSVYIREFPIYRYDIDMNLHVSNIKYLHWLLETLPDDIIDNCYLSRIDGRFINEACFGDSMISLTQPEVEDFHFSHTIKVKGSNLICATAKSDWKAR